MFLILCVLSVFDSMAANTPIKGKDFDIGTRSPKLFQLNSTEDVALTLDLTNKFLRNLQNELSSTNSQGLIHILNSKFEHVQFNQGSRLEERLRVEVFGFKKCIGGRQRKLYDEKVKKVAILASEIVNVRELKLQNVSFAENEQLNDKENSECFENKGIRIDNSSMKNRPRVVKKLEENIEKNLGFVETFGVIPKKVVCETFDGEKCQINLDGEQSKATGYENMNSEKQANVREILHVVDNSMISDRTYHELAMKVEELPRKGAIVSCRNEVNSQFEVLRTPGLLPGSYLSFRKEIVNCIEGVRSKTNKFPEKLKLKVSGDGAKVSRISNFIVISYSVIESEVSSCHLNQRVLAIVKCEENYANLEKTLGPLFDEINDINSKGFINVGEDRCEIELFIGGDMKFIQLLLGLNSSIGTYACPWCKVSKDERGNVTLPWDHYHQCDQFRTIQEIKSAKSKQFGVKASPLVDVEPHHYVPDELHLLMRITGVLLRNLIYDSKAKDEYAKILGQPTDNLDLLVKAIQSCGVSFNIWTSKSGDLDWTSLSGSELKKVLSELPAKLLFCIHEDTASATSHLWNEFRDIYEVITDKHGREYNGRELFDRMQAFVMHFLDIGRRNREGYQACNITPYIHTLVYHVPYFLQEYGSLAFFSGQGVEKTNDVIKRIHHSKSSKVDPTADALLVRKRLEQGHEQNLSRVKRKYEKSDDVFWGTTKSEMRKSKVQRILCEQQEANSAYNPSSEMCENIEDLSVAEIKKKLLELGVKTRKRTKASLLDELRQQLSR